MKIKIGYDIGYGADVPTPMVIMLNVHPSRQGDLVGIEQISTAPEAPITYYRDSFGNNCGRLVAPAGGVVLSCRAVVRDSGLPDEVVPTAQQIPIEQLPDECLVYLMGSRYCETDKLTDLAWSLFKDTRPGWERVQAICDYVHNHLTFGYHFAAPTKSAHSVHEERQGVCRDFAHLAVTLCRCMNIPTRYCTGYLGDIGVPPEDFSDGFFGLVRGLSFGQLVHVRCPPQHPAHRPHSGRPRPRCRRRAAFQFLRPNDADQVRGLHGRNR